MNTNYPRGSLESHLKHQLEVERLIAMELFVSNFVPDGYDGPRTCPCRGNASSSTWWPMRPDDFESVPTSHAVRGDFCRQVWPEDLSVQRRSASCPERPACASIARAEEVRHKFAIRCKQ